MNMNSIFKFDLKGTKLRIMKQGFQSSLIADDQLLSLPEIIVHVENICKKTLTRLLLQTELVHLVVHVDRLPGDLLSRATHSQEPRKPLQKH